MEEQAIDRVYRIGLKNELKVYRLLSEDTIEMNIEQVKKKKDEIAKTVTDQKSKKKDIRTPMEGLIGSLFDDRPFKNKKKPKSKSATQEQNTQRSQTQNQRATPKRAMKRSGAGVVDLTDTPAASVIDLTDTPASKKSKKS